MSLMRLALLALPIMIHFRRIIDMRLYILGLPKSPAKKYKKKNRRLNSNDSEEKQRKADTDIGEKIDIWQRLREIPLRNSISIQNIKKIANDNQNSLCLSGVLLISGARD